MSACVTSARASIVQVSLAVLGLTIFTALAVLSRHRSQLGYQLGYWRRQGTSLSRRCTSLPGGDTAVVWDDALDRCEPDVCRGSFLPELADVSGVVPAGVVCGNKLQDSAAARACLANKRLLMLGALQMSLVGIVVAEAGCVLTACAKRNTGYV